MEKKYWNNFYKGKNQVSTISFPTQFALFVLPDLIQNKVKALFEFGCGNGRDASYFSEFVERVYGFDASDAAIHQARNNSNRVSYTVLDLTSFDLTGYEEASSPNTVFYSRFFLHALTNGEIEDFLYCLRTSMQSGARFYTEFRTNDDRHGSRITEEHYRNYIRLDNFESLVEPYFYIKYKTSGVGMAKYGDDDAFVVRYILEKR